MFCCGEEAAAQATETTEKEEPVKEEVQPEPEEPKPKFTMTIVGARGFRNTDWLPGQGKPDCYCEVKKGEEVLFKTKTIDDSMMPRWHEEFEIADLEDNAELELKVWDKDVVGADFLGKVNIVPDSFMEKGCNKDFKMTNSGTTMAYLGLKIKTRGQADYPEAPPAQFTVAVEKAADAKEYGLEIDSQDQTHLQIYEVDTGAFKKYNESVAATPEVQVMKSDFIAAVNDKSGKAAEMMAQFRESSKVEVKIVRATELGVIIENEDKKKKHGLTFPTTMKNDVLVVMDIGDGYIKEYNDNCKQASQKIRKYDRIVSVKSQVGKAATLKRLLETTTGKFQLGIQRMVPEEAIQASGGIGAAWW